MCRSDLEFSRALLVTYRTFATPVELLSALIERFRSGPPDRMTDDQQIEYYYINKVVPVRVRCGPRERTTPHRPRPRP